MKTFFRNATGKRFLAVLLVLALATGAVFAAPLSAEGKIEAATVYDSSYKAVKDATSVSSGYILKTDAGNVTLSNSNLIVQVEPSSLIQFINVDGAIELYLLDGRAAVASTEAYTVRTTVTSYAAKANTEIYVISDDAEETAYVSSGSAVATNLITKAKTTLGAGTYIDNSKSNFVPAQTTRDDYWAKAEQPSQTSSAPESKETSAPATSQEVSQPEASAPAALTRTFKYAGYSATIEAYIGKAFLTYPSFVTNSEIDAAAGAAALKYPQYIKGIYYEINEPGRATITYPETYGVYEFNFAMDLLAKELPAYLNEVFSREETLIVEEPAPVQTQTAAVAETATEEVAAAPAATAATALTRTFTYAGFEATVNAYVGVAYITYPSFVTEAEINAAAAAAAAKYPQYVQGIYYEVTEPGLLTVNYPESYGIGEFNFAMDLIGYELPYYIAEVLAQPESVKAEAPAEQPAAPAEETPSAPAEPAPAAPAQPDKTPIETTPRPEAQPEPAEEKKTNFRFGGTYGVIYGLANNPSSDYLRPTFTDRTIVYGKNLEVFADPTIYINNFTFGLHLAVDLCLFNDFEFVNPFENLSFDGITASVNSIARFIGVIGYESDNFTFRVDRKSELEFKSPVYDSMKRAYDTEDKLLATASLELGKFSLEVFMDDLQLTAKLNDRGQYAGARAAFTFGKFEIGASAIANLNGGFEDMELYPAVDLALPFTFQNTTFEFNAGFAVQLTNEGLDGMLAEGKINITAGAFTFGVGAAYNKDHHFNDLVNNGPADIIDQFDGDSLDILLSAALDTKHFKISGSIDAPFTLSGNGSSLAYNTVKTKNGDVESLSADTFNFQADVIFGKFTFSAGAVYNGLCGRLATLAKTIIKNTDGKRAALAGLLDPEISTYYGIMGISFEHFDAYVRADLTRVNGRMTVPVSFGASVNF